jgi:hypothetical protein
MRKFSLLILIAVSLLGGCKKNDEKEPAAPVAYQCASCVKASEALAANDSSSAGVYKGILAGSTGTFKFILKNGTGAILAVVNFDGITDTLHCDSLSSWVPGQSIYNAVFTGTKGITLTFSVSADGRYPSVTATITGHNNVSATVAKETSASLLKCYEGTASGTDVSVILNWWIKENNMYGVYKDQNGKTGVLRGTVSGTTVNGTVENSTFTGKIEGEKMSGTWKSSDKSGTWTGKRTL